MIDPFEEARAIELDERLATGVRGVHRATGPPARGDGERLRRARLAGRRPARGGRARRPHHGLARRRPPRRHARPSDAVAVRRLRRRRAPTCATSWSAAAGSCATASTSRFDVAARELRGRRSAHDRARRSTTSACSSRTTPSLGDGPLGLVRDAALVMEDGVVVAVERAGAAGDERIDADGRCVIPGFVDSHTHLVFAGDRGDEFAARMAGAPYAAGGIRVTTEATRAAVQRAARRARRRPPPRGAAGRHHAPRDQVGLRARRRDRAALVRGRRRAHRRRHVPRRPRRPGRVRGPRRRLRRARLRRHARRLRAARPLDRRLLRGRRVRRGPVARGARGRAAPPGSACACTATSSARARACGSRSSSAPPRSTTAPT